MVCWLCCCHRIIGFIEIVCWGASVTVMGASVSDGDGAVGCVVVTESSASSKSYVGARL